MGDIFAKSMTKFFRFFADTFFAKRYGHRAVVLETVAGVPGMVAGMLFRSNCAYVIRQQVGDALFAHQCRVASSQKVGL